MHAKHAKWVPLLGDELARRIVALGVADPVVFCREAVRVEIEKAEGRRRSMPVTAEQVKCPHPEKKRALNGRCGECGLRGLPARAQAEKGGGS